MGKEKMCINNLLSWDDIVNLGNPLVEKMHVLNEPVLLESLCEGKFQKKQFHEVYLKYVVEEFNKVFKSEYVPNTEFDFALLFEKNEEGKWRATFSKVAFFASLLDLVTPSAGNNEYFKIAEELLKIKDKDEFKEEVLKRLKERKLDFIKRLSDVENGKSIYNEYGVGEVDIAKAYRSARSEVSWFIKNIDAVFEFLNRDYPIEVLEELNKDKFMSLMCSTNIISYEDQVTEKHGILHVKEDKLSDEEMMNLQVLLNYINNYLLIAKYISEENNCEYNDGIALDIPEFGLLKPDTKYIRKFYNDMITTFNDRDFIEFSSYEELLGAKAKETWERITNKKLVMNIKVNFEMIKSGKKDVYNMDRKAPRVTSSKEKRAAQLKQAYDLLDEKFAYYESKNPVVTLSGISNFVGYFAQFYENGCVVLDKYYRLHTDRKGKEVVVPASGEAIYIMNYEDFANLCQCTKPELIEEKNNNNPNVDRKNHTKNWRKNLDDIIDGEGYGGLNLNFLNQLTLELTGESVKEKKKTNE